ncbi:MAG: hypothetical protein J1E85_00510 [Ruminococcus sp.]|nr:hypothetical protein [Ruminococcus sp.]
MSVNKKKLICILTAIIGLAVFILELFVFQKPDGFWGLIICLASVYLMIGGVIGYCKYSGNFGGTLGNLLEILFWLP